MIMLVFMLFSFYYVRLNKTQESKIKSVHRFVEKIIIIDSLSFNITSIIMYILIYVN